MLALRTSQVKDPIVRAYIILCIGVGELEYIIV